MGTVKRVFKEIGRNPLTTLGILTGNPILAAGGFAADTGIKAVKDSQKKAAKQQEKLEAEYQRQYEAAQAEQRRAQEEYNAMMERQAEMQSEYMNQMALTNAKQLELQEEAAKAGDTESFKSPGDFPQANDADTRRKQMLRRGLMSTFTRYTDRSQRTPKASKMSG